jgi:hypothetical protein
VRQGILYGTGHGHSGDPADDADTVFASADHEMNNGLPRFCGSPFRLCAVMCLQARRESQQNHSSCHPERSETKPRDLRILFRFAVESVPRSFDSLRSLRMTALDFVFLLFVRIKADNHIGYLEEPNHGDSQTNLQNQDGRDADGEFLMEGFMAEGVHAHQRADAAAYGRDAHEGGLRDAPFLFLGFLLIDEHKQEAHCIDYQ